MAKADAEAGAGAGAVRLVLLLSLAEVLPSPAAVCSVLPRRPLLPAGDDEEAKDEQALLTVADFDLNDGLCLLWLLLAR